MNFKAQAKQNQLLERLSTQHLVVGIDIAQQSHGARAVNFRGITLGTPLHFSNNDLQQLLAEYDLAMEQLQVIEDEVATTQARIPLAFRIPSIVHSVSNVLAQISRSDDLPNKVIFNLSVVHVSMNILHKGSHNDEVPHASAQFVGRVSSRRYRLHHCPPLQFKVISIY